MSLKIQTTTGQVEWKIPELHLVEKLMETPELQKQYAVHLVSDQLKKGILSHPCQISSWSLDPGVMLLAEVTDSVQSEPSTSHQMESGERQPLEDLTNFTQSQSSAAPQIEFGQPSTESPAVGEDLSSENQKVWTYAATKLLVHLRLTKDEDFVRPKCKKSMLWKRIALDMVAKGHDFTGPECDSKFRNLYATYKRNKKKAGTTGEAAVTWEFFKEFNDVFSGKAKVVVPANLLGSTLNPSTLYSENALNGDSEVVGSEAEDEPQLTEEPQEKKKKGKGKKDTPPMTSKLYYKEKLTLEKQRAAEKKAREEARDKERKAYRDQKLSLMQELLQNIKGSNPGHSET